MRLATVIAAPVPSFRQATTIPVATPNGKNRRPTHSVGDMSDGLSMSFQKSMTNKVVLAMLPTLANISSTASGNPKLILLVLIKTSAHT
jgi:hypothetical protein